MSTLTGQDATGEAAGTGWSQIQAGSPAVLLTGDSPRSPSIRDHHYYAAIDYDPWTGWFTLFDPYGIQRCQADGRYGLFWANAPFMDQNFTFDVAVSAGWNEPTESVQAFVAAPKLWEGLPLGNDSRSSASARGAEKTTVTSPLLADAVFARSNIRTPGDAVESLVHALNHDGHDQDAQAADFARRMDSLFAAREIIRLISDPSGTRPSVLSSGPHAT